MCAKVNYDILADPQAVTSSGPGQHQFPDEIDNFTLQNQFLMEIIEWGLVEGKPLSATRQQYTERLLGDGNLPKFTTLGKSFLRTAIGEQPTGTFLAPLIHSILKDTLVACSHLPSISKHITHNGGAGNMDDLSWRMNVFRDFAEEICLQQLQWSRDRVKRGQKLEATSLGDLDGSRVHINNSGLISIKYYNDSGIVEGISHKAGSSLTPSPFWTTERFILQNLASTFVTVSEQHSSCEASSKTRLFCVMNLPNRAPFVNFGSELLDYKLYHQATSFRQFKRQSTLVEDKVFLNRQNR